MPVTTENQYICYNCFSQLDSPEGACPYCGFDLAENEKKYPVALRAGTVLNGRYIIGRVLGQGGFGITYLALDTQLNARVAIKEFMPTDIATRVEGTTVSVVADTKSQDFAYGAERFQEEARTLAKFIGHPNIAGVSSYFDENDTSYFVMDYIEGISFKSYIANAGGKVGVDEVLNVMIPVLRALTAVHEEGFIHRDVTPDNIYISKDGNVKLLDFGSARYSLGDKSKSLDVILKVGYAPKEQYTRRGRQGPYTDVYSCAACFYAALTGYLPPESLDRLEHDELIPVSQCGVEVPEWLDKAILKGLAVQPEDRFQSAAEFLEAIENQQVVEVAAPAGTEARPGPEDLLTRLKKKPALLGGIAAAVLVIAGIGYFAGGGRSSTVTSDGQPASAPSAIAEALAPKVTIAGEEYSTAATELNLGEVRLTDEDFATLATMTQLKSLRIRMDHMTDFQWLESLTSLESLDLGGENAVYQDLDFLSGLTKLKYLNLPIIASGLPGYDLSALSELTELVHIDLPHSAKDLAPLQNLTKLEELMLKDGYGVEVSFSSLEPLQNLTNLTKLGLRVRGENPIDISPLSGLIKLQELELRVEMTRSISGGCAISGTGLSALSGMQDLRFLTLEVEGLSDISPLRNLENLEFVSIERDYSEITDWSPVDHVKSVVGRP